jgi:hypothetical protein
MLTDVANELRDKGALDEEVLDRRGLAMAKGGGGRSVQQSAEKAWKS